MRVLAACKSCRVQFDVSGKSPGETIPCHCGGVITVPAARIAETRLVRCASCGAVRGSGGDNCEFCGARFSSIDKGWGTICPSCFCRLPNDAQFCVECGIKINPQILGETRGDLPCPRCSTTLQSRMLDKIETFECAGCGGMWLPVETFESICSNTQSFEAATRGLALHHSHAKFEITDADKVKYIPCPACKQLMNRRNFAGCSGVIVDTCRDCGVWLDDQELNRIVQFIRTGGLLRAEEREHEHIQSLQKAFTPPMPPPPAVLPGSYNNTLLGDVVRVVGNVLIEIGKDILD